MGRSTRDVLGVAETREPVECSAMTVSNACISSRVYATQACTRSAGATTRREDDDMEVDDNDDDDDEIKRTDSRKAWDGCALLI